MSTPVIMPKVDMDQEKATIISWEKMEGETVKQDETLLTVETEKVAIDVTSPASGVLAGIKFQSGDVVPVATVIAQILKPGETLTDQTVVTPPPSSAAPVGKQPVAPPAPAGPVQASPLALRVAQELGVDISKVPSQKGRISREDVEAYATSLKGPTHTEGAVPGKVAATPAARRISEETGIPLENIQGSGPFGRIQAADVKPSAKTQTPAFVSSDRQAEIIPLIGIRAKIAQRMQASFQDAPHIAETVVADVSRLEDTRAHLNEMAVLKGEGKVSLTAILVKLVAWALERNPYINSSLIDEKIYLWKEINIGVATALENGLIVPVIHNANQLSFSETAEKINDLGLRARQGKLELEEVQRGTFTISNLGMYGINQFRAIINPPENAILAVGAAVRKPIVIDDRDTIAVRPVISLTLSADHRVIDGVVAAKFLADLIKVVEHPEILLA
jgi:pyruvate dehydrogenase E2 component (dihydrolipoamide acetyltransferase)